MAPTRKSFSAKFKAEVLKYITEKGCSNSAAARHFGIDEKNRRWKTQSGSSCSDQKWIFQSQTTTWFWQATTLRGLGGACLSADSIETAAETTRYKKRNPTKSS